ncbi:hypothetical protein [Candidatus Nitrosotenuis chungbukensis]|uniref:hypothetical protein n=1 Tax=Candidatus Nitrosotenuis chungbukensis TaxID=1353246 RepID=UPI0012FEF90D|nr:hypothetical protein [Candidatus Nitrosotenuis chungbukensis]
MIVDFIYYIYKICIMVKTLRISDENHKEMLKIQGEIQAETGKLTTMDDALAEMIKSYKKANR